MIEGLIAHIPGVCREWFRMCISDDSASPQTVGGISHTEKRSSDPVCRRVVEVLSNAALLRSVAHSVLALDAVLSAESVRFSIVCDATLSLLRT